MQLLFRVTYKPVYGARIRTHKQCILDGFSSTLAYNQGANKIETRYYSENLRGAVERMGNIEKTYTCHLAFLSQVPKIGTKFNSQYYITNVASELYPNYIKCTIALSKNFNRLSEHIGINTQKRMWEISERQAVARESNHTVFFVISESESENDLTTSQSNTAIASPAKLLLNQLNVSAPASTAVITPRDKNHNKINESINIALPVVASAFNTSMTLTFDFVDNYSAGQKLENYVGEAIDGSDTASGFWSNYVPYTDYYGRLYYLEYVLLCGSISESDANNLPIVSSSFAQSGTNAVHDYILYRKDNKEIPQVTAQITVVADNEDFIIGTALCKNCALVNQTPKTYRLYAFKHNLNVLNSRIYNLAEMLESGEALDTGFAFNGFTETTNNTSVGLIAMSDNALYKAWAIVTELTETTIAVAEEDGTSETTQTIYEGGEILIGKNNSRLLGQTIYITAKNKIND